MKRFVTALLDAPIATNEFITRIDPMDNWLRTLELRLKTDWRPSLACEISDKVEFKALQERIRARGLRYKVKGGSLEQKLARHRQNLSDAKTRMQRHVQVDVPRVLAAWSVCARSGPALLQASVNQMFDKDSIGRGIASAKEQVLLSSRAQYPKFVELLNASQLWVDRHFAEDLFIHMANGASNDDILYCIEKTDSSISRHVRISRFRKSAKRFQRVFGNEYDLDAFLELHCYVHDNLQVEVVDAVLRWMEKFSASVLTPRITKIAQSLLENLLRLVKIKQFSEQFAGSVITWSSRANAIAECFPEEANYPKRLRIWLRRLGYYQQMHEKMRRIPKSLDRVLHVDDKQQKELVYLKAQIESGSVTSTARERYRYLTNSVVDEAKCQRKNIRTAQEACLLTGLAALRHLLFTHTQKIWHERMGRPFLKHWSDERKVEMTTWVVTMSTAELKLLKQVWEAHDQFGVAYKAHLPFNRNWLEEMSRQGIDVDTWMNPPPEDVKIGKEKINISVSRDPAETFMMGTYFGTCLSQGGCNEMSVLANAAHANKQVIFLRTIHGELMGRLLITISRKNELLRYALYLSNLALTNAERKTYSDVVEGYCARLAARIGIVLGCNGRPSSFQGHFWYDDGIETWSELARKTIEIHRSSNSWCCYESIDTPLSLVTISIRCDENFAARYVLQD